MAKIEGPEVKEVLGSTLEKRVSLNMRVIFAAAGVGDRLLRSIEFAVLVLHLYPSFFVGITLGFLWVVCV